MAPRSSTSSAESAISLFDPLLSQDHLGRWSWRRHTPSGGSRGPNFQPYPTLLPAARTSRALSRISGNTAVASARVQGNAEVKAAKVDGVAAVAAKAQQDAALLGQVEQTLAHTVPHASGRLATVADLAAVSMAGIVADAARRIGR